MKMSDFPSAFSRFTIANSSVASCGVSTAVGSSRIRISAPRKSALRISTRCCCPTVVRLISAPGSTARPNCCDSSVTRFSAARSSSSTPSRVGSMPRTMFSATVITGISMKCWCTIPIPATIASFAEAKVTGSPRSRISPASAL